MKKWFLVTPLVVLALGFSACSSTSSEDRELQKLANTDKNAIYERAEGFYAKKDYSEARKLFTFVYNTFPNDPLGHKAALRVADTYYEHNDRVNLTEAQLRYRDFANRYPNDPDRDYALLMLGNTYTKRKLRPDRELNETRKALKAYRQLINLYPHSSHVEEARQKIAEVRAVLAQHEWQVAKFYARNKLWLAAEWRLEYLKEHYPEYPQMKAVDALMAESKKAYEDRVEEFRKKMKKKAPKKDH